MTGEMPRWPKMRQALPAILPVLLLSVILPTGDVVSDFLLIMRMFRGEEGYSCKCSEGLIADKEEFYKCEKDSSGQYCTNQDVSSSLVCVENRNSSSGYSCVSYKIWSSQSADYENCTNSNASVYCSTPGHNPDICGKTHPRMASAMFLFFMLSYLMGLVTCCRLEGLKTASIISALFNAFPQYCRYQPRLNTIKLSKMIVLAALRVIKSIYEDPIEGQRQKLYYESNIGMHETFLESVPTGYILTVLFYRTWGVYTLYSQDDWFIYSCDQTLGRIIIGEITVLFFISFCFSLASASFGVAKCLKSGVARLIAPTDGLFSLRFFLAFLACGSCLAIRGYFLCFESDKVKVIFPFYHFLTD